MGLQLGKKQFGPRVILFLEDQSEPPLSLYEVHSKMLQTHHVHEISLALTQKLVLSGILSYICCYCFELLYTF